jgi:hypothetical protein
MNQQQMTTDTPRTDAAKVDKCGMTFVSLEFAQELERELNASQAEVAKLNHQLLKTESDLIQSQDINSFLDAEFRIACKQAEKAEAEVERLKEAIISCLHITNCYDGNYAAACDNVDLIVRNALKKNQSLSQKTNQ